MATTYFKRYCMQIDLRRDLDRVSQFRLRDSFELVPWREELIESHAVAKYLSFHQEMDTHVFSCLGSQDGCRRLMRDISFRENFLPEATWLAIAATSGRPAWTACGTIQALLSEPGIASIQNVGVAAPFRGQGVGRCLIARSLHGCRELELDFVQLEVTAHNTRAIRLYQELGFKIRKIVYKSADIRGTPGPVN